MTKIFAVYLQASGFPSQLSEYVFECCQEHLGQHGISMSYVSLDVDPFFVCVDGRRAAGVDLFPYCNYCGLLISLLEHYHHFSVLPRCGYSFF